MAVRDSEGIEPVKAMWLKKWQRWGNKKLRKVFVVLVAKDIWAGALCIRREATACSILNGVKGVEEFEVVLGKLMVVVFGPKNMLYLLKRGLEHCLGWRGYIIFWRKRN